MAWPVEGVCGRAGRAILVGRSIVFVLVPVLVVRLRRGARGAWGAGAAGAAAAVGPADDGEQAAGLDRFEPHVEKVGELDEAQVVECCDADRDQPLYDRCVHIELGEGGGDRGEARRSGGGVVHGGEVREEGGGTVLGYPLRKDG